MTGVQETARRETAAYEHGHEQPVGGYAGAASVFGAAVLTAAGVARLTGRRLPDRFPLVDVLLGGIATHKFGRIIAKDSITSPLRVPFTRFEGAAGAGELNEQVRGGSQARHTAGELISCPFCVAPWIATGYVAGMVLAPRITRAWAAAFTAVAVSDWLQHGYAHIRTA